MSETLTGKTKHRLEQRILRTPLLVLQVEVDTVEYDPVDLRDIHGRSYKYYRDATVEDAIVLAQRNKEVV